MIVNSPRELAIYIRDHRKKLSKGQRDVAAPVGLKQTTVSNFETKPETTKIETLYRILASTGLEISICPRGQSPSQSEWKEEW